MNVVGRILHFGKTRRMSPALVEGNHTITYGELAELARRTASHLAARGLRRGDRIGLLLKDTSDFVAALLGATLMGGVAVPLDWRARPVEKARLMKGLGLTLVLHEPGTHAADGSAIFLDEEWRHDVSRSQIAADPPGDWQDVFVVSATSGSTGAPRFTQMTHQQYYFAVAGMLELMDLSGVHRYLCNLPLYYSGGRNSCLAHLLRGDCVVLYPSLFSPAEYLDVIRRYGITVAVVVPSMVRQLLAASGSKPLLPDLAKLFCTGAPLYTEEKLQAARILTPSFHERFGTAETLAVSVLRPVDFAERAASVGQPHSLVEIEVVDDEERPLSGGEVGNLRMRGPGLAAPLGEPGKSSFRGGWYYPGEVACLDEAGYIFLHGRTSDVIMRSGAKVYPAEVEGALVEHPGVDDAAVLGHHDADGEESVIAFVVPRGELSLGDLLAYCRARLTPHKVPRQIHFRNHLPRNTAGKVDKLALARTLE